MDKTEVYTSEYYPEISQWFNARGMDAPPPEFLPVNGVIIPGLACGFLYLTDTPLALLDCFVTNPVTDKEDRGHALDLLTTRLLSLAQSLGCKIIICNTKHEGLKSRALALGFTDLGEQFAFSKELN